MTVALRLLMYINTNSEDDQTIPNSSTLPAFSSVLSINTLIKHIESNGSRPSPLHQFQVRALSTHGLRGAPPSNHRRLHKRHQTIDVHTTKGRLGHRTEASTRLWQTIKSTCVICATKITRWTGCTRLIYTKLLAKLPHFTHPTQLTYSDAQHLQAPAQLRLVELIWLVQTPA